MNFEQLKENFIKLKKEELEYINNVSAMSAEKKFTEFEKIEIYRKSKKYERELNDILFKVYNIMLELDKKGQFNNINDIFVEFDLDKDYLLELENKSEYYRKFILKMVGIDNFKYKLTYKNIKDITRTSYKGLNIDKFLINQMLIESPIYIFDCFYVEDWDLGSYSKACYRKLFDEKYGITDEIYKEQMETFERDKIIIKAGKYVYATEVEEIFSDELLNLESKTINQCTRKTKIRIKKLNYERSPEYKEKLLLDKINKLYKKVRGKQINQELLFSGKFLNVIKEVYELPNNTVVEKEKVMKNNGKNSVIIIPITQGKEYIITFQNRLKDKIIAEFPSGYIEDGEDVIEAAKRELLEETGYLSDDLFVVDHAYTSPGIDNSVTYIVIANDCKREKDVDQVGTEFLEYGLFSKLDLQYLINNDIMNGAMNKLAYYNLTYNIAIHSMDGIKMKKEKVLNPYRKV